MELRQIRYFVAVAEELHFRRASQRIHVAQPSLSLQVRLLEEELGVLLLKRSNRKVELTPAGQQFLNRARMILGEIETSARQAKSVASGEGGVLRLGFVPTSSFATLPDLVNRIAGSLPQVQIEFEEHSAAQLFSLLEARKLDIAMLQAPFVPSIFESRQVGLDHLQVVLSRHHALARRPVLKAEDLLEETLILPDPKTSQAIHEAVVNAFRSHGLPKQMQVVEQVHTAINLAQSSLGIVLVPEAARPFLPSGCVMIPIEPAPQPIPHLLVWRRDNLAPLITRVISLLPKAAAAKRSKIRG